MTHYKSKDEIIGSIKRALRNTSLEPEIGEANAVDLATPRSTNKGPSERFAANLRSVGGLPYIVGENSTLSSVLEKVLAPFKDESCLVSDDPSLAEFGALEILSGAVKTVLSTAETPNEVAAKANLGLIRAQSGIADTGTVILFHSRGRDRLASLLPRTCIVLLEEKKIFAQKLDYLAYCHQAGTDLSETPQSWVTGPSLTADIEKVLIRGAHGPRQLIVIIH